MSIKGLSVPDYPNPFGAEGETISAFVVLRKFDGDALKDEINLECDVFASEAAFDEGRSGFPQKHKYTVTEIIDLEAANMNALKDAMYAVLTAYDATFANAEIVNNEVPE